MTLAVCPTCLKETTHNELTDVTEFDFDGICFLEKLMSCVVSESEIGKYDNLQMCQSCIGNLKLSYEFKQTVLNSLKTMSSMDQNSFTLSESEVTSEIEIGVPQNAIMRLKIDDKQLSNEQEENIHELIKQIKQEIAIPKFKNECVDCSLSFKNKSELQKHFRVIHNISYMCMYCGKSYQTSSLLKDHVATSHKQTISCPRCMKSFPQISSLSRHLKTHFAPPGQKTKKTPFLCMICGKSFPFSNGAARHMRIHDGVKKHECQICNKKFNQSTHLQVHMRRHTGEKPYTCHICGESFSLRARLSTHLKTWHRGEKHEENSFKTEVYLYNN